MKADALHRGALRYSRDERARCGRQARKWWLPGKRYSLLILSRSLLFVWSTRAACLLRLDHQGAGGSAIHACSASAVEDADRVFRLPRLAAVRRRSELGGDLVKSRAAWKFTPLRLGNQTSEFLAGMGGRKLLCRGPLGDIYKAIGSAAGECAMQLQRDESRADSKIAAGGGPQLYKHSFSPFGNHKRVDQRNGTGMRLVRGHGGTSSWIDGIRHD